MKKLTVLVVVILVLALCFVGCAKEEAPAAEPAATEEKAEAPAEEKAEAPAEEDDGIVIGYAVQRMVDEYWNNQLLGLERAGEELGYTIESADCNNDAQTCVDICLNFISRGVDALFVSAPDPSACGPVVEAADAAGIPVFAFDMRIEGATFIAHDDYVAGEMAGAYACKYFEENFAGQTPVVALIEHKAAADPCQLRIDGFVATVAEAYPDAKFLPQQDAEGLLENATNIMSDIITANPDVNMVFCINDSMALGCVAAIEGRDMSDKIAVFGQGGCGVSTFEKLAEEGSCFVYTTGYAPEQCGYDSVYELINPYLEGEECPDRWNGALVDIDKAEAKNWL